MKRNLLIVLSLVLALFFFNSTAMAYNSAVFLDDDTATFLPNAAAWTESNFNPTTYGQGYHFARRNGSIPTAGPYLRMVTPGALDVGGGGVSGTLGSYYQAHLRWSGGNRCSNVRVEVWNFTANSLETATTIDQTIRTQSFNWNPVGGIFQATPGNAYEIRVYANNTIVSGGGINCVVTVDGGAFFQQTTDSSDTFNLTKYIISDEPGIEFSQASQIAPSGLASCSLASGNWTTLASVTLTTPASYGYIWVHANGISRHFSDGITRVCIAPAGSACTSFAPVMDQSSTEVSEGSYDNETRWVVSDTFPATGVSQTYHLKGCRGSNTQNVDLLWDDFVGMYFPTRY
jgi:hypothetical protein